MPTERKDCRVRIKWHRIALYLLIGFSTLLPWFIGRVAVVLFAALLFQSELFSNLWNGTADPNIPIPRFEDKSDGC